MRTVGLTLALLAAAAAVSAQTDRDFTGTWQLNQGQSEIRDFSSPPARAIRVSQNTGSVTAVLSPEPGAPESRLVMSLDGSSRRSKLGEATWNVAAKWEGSALLLNVIVSGPSDYSLFERWVRSPDGSRLTITRNVNRRGEETESVFVYDNPNVAGTNPPEEISSAPPRAEESRTVARSSRYPARPADRAAIRPGDGIRRLPDTPAAPDQPEPDYVVKSGTRILMRLTNSLNTRRTAVGDQVYLQTAVPVFVNSRMVIPVGSYVTGSVTEAQRAGRVKKSELNLRFESVTLPNGVTRDFRGRAGSVDSKGSLDRAEGRIEGDGKSGNGARTVAQTTAAGAGIGSIAGAAAGHLGAGLGIGAAAGAAAGLAGILGSRGSEVILPQGTTIELVLDRDLVFTAEDLRQR